jgi:hypothetical protein|tara:strand:- start:688 stop:1287 length:600 start_codon:yes stop_codon:yes gene_type:complete
MADLVTRDQYKSYKGIEHFKDDVKIDSLLSPISTLVKTYCGTSFIDHYSSAKTEIFDISDAQTAELFLTESPLNSVTSVQERDGIASDYITLVNNTDYYIDTEHDRLYRIDGDTSSKSWAKGFASIRVVYTAGYSTTPQDLRLAIYDLITYYLKEEYKGRKSLAGATIQNETSTTIREDIGFPDHIKRILDMYRIVDVI